MAKLYPTNPILILATTLAAGALLLGLWSWQQWMQTQAAAARNSNRPDVQAATVLPDARPLPDIMLTDEQGRQRNITSLGPNWSLWFFGFTHCPDVCPNTLGLLTAVKKQLARQAPGKALDIVFVSVDPKRDTPAKLAEYLRYFDPDFTGLTGPKTAIDQLTGAVYLPYSIGEPDQNAPDQINNYDVEHSGALLLVDPQAAVRAYFSPPHDRQVLIKDLQTLIEDQ